MMRNYYYNQPSKPAPSDPWSQTQPSRPLPETQPYAPEEYAPHPLPPLPPQPRFYPAPPRRSSRIGGRGACLVLPVLLLGALAIVLIYFLAPFRTNILLLGIDARPDQQEYGRSDTMILTTFEPLKPYVGALSIPRDLWVQVPGHGENRINTAHFFGEIDHPGSGPQAAEQVVRQDFGVNVDYYVRIQFTGFKDIVDALGGVDVTLPQAMSGYTAGTHHLNGDQALALVRDRETSDDFYRMQRGQIFLKSVWRQVIKPVSWSRLPAVYQALSHSVDTNVPVWLWPRLGLALLRLGPDKIDARSINREMVKPFTTSGGAQVLGPDWNKINPVLMQMFGQ